MTGASETVPLTFSRRYLDTSAVLRIALCRSQFVEQGLVHHYPQYSSLSSPRWMARREHQKKSFADVLLQFNIPKLPHRHAPWSVSFWLTSVLATRSLTMQVSTKNGMIGGGRESSLPRGRAGYHFCRAGPHSNIQAQPALSMKKAAVESGHASEIRMFSPSAWLPECQPRPWLTT